MRRIKFLALFVLTLSLAAGCVEEYNKFDRPEWLAGRLYTQILLDSTNLSTFAECLKLSGYDTIINTSGSYTVFAPNNNAFSLYFQEKGYNSPSDIPKDELVKLVKYHIVQNPWSKTQLTSLDVWGWIDPQDELNNEPRGYKRETVYEDDDISYGVSYTKKLGLRLVDTLETSFRRKVHTDSRKFVPIFFKQYFDLYNLKLDDFEFYFDRTIDDPKDIFYLDARIISDEAFAENGFIYNIDRVIEPLQNAYQFMQNNDSYSKFFNLINFYPVFNYNQTETFNQPEALAGLEFDSVFNLTFDNLAFDLTNEKTEAPPGEYGLPSEVTIRYHNGIVVPSNEAIEKFNNDYLPGGDFWPGIENTPENIRNLFLNTHLSYFPIYKTNMETGFVNGEKDRITFDPSIIIEKSYGSNATLLAVNEALVPRAFSSITGPVYLRRGYSKVMYAIEASGLLPALKRERTADNEFMFFVESDANTNIDTSFMYVPGAHITRRFYAQDPSGEKFYFTSTDLRTLLMNHVTVRPATHIPRKEFIPNLAGNFIVFNNETGEVRGTGPTTDGYKNLGADVTVIPEQIDISADNGSTYSIEDWFSFPVNTLVSTIHDEFPEFYDLIDAAELIHYDEFDFYSEGDKVTVFAMDAGAVAQVLDDSLELEDLQALILNHFIRKNIIFTDGYASSGYYETLRLDESSSENNIVFSKIYIETGINEIIFRDNSGGVYETISESDRNNFIISQTNSAGNVTIEVTQSTGVVHSISKPLKYELLDVN